MKNQAKITNKKDSNLSRRDFMGAVAARGSLYRCPQLRLGRARQYTSQ